MLWLLLDRYNTTIHGILSRLVISGRNGLPYFGIAGSDTNYRASSSSSFSSSFNREKRHKQVADREKD